jgi:hypothetical protein
MSKFIRESQSGYERIDKDAGIIYGVKVLGPQSRNGRVYEAEAIANALPLYEGVSVNLNHQRIEPKAQVQQDRRIEDRWGVLKNARLKDGSIYADLHYLKTHPATPQLIEAAERFPETFGLSHDAAGDEQVIDGERRVVELFEIRSVDVVADPATNDGLFESYQPAETNVSAMEARLQRKASRMNLLEVRCPTGKGGGIDNSCKRKGSGKGIASKPTASKGFTGISSADASKYKMSKNDAEFINELAKQGRLETSVEDIQRRERKWNLTPSKVGKFKGDLAVPNSGTFAGVPVRIEGWSGLQASAGPDMKMLPSGKPTGYIVSVHDKEPYGSYTVGRIVIPMEEMDGPKKMESHIQRRDESIDHLLEVRCPTGKGGGIDNSCKRKGSVGGSGSSKLSDEARFARAERRAERYQKKGMRMEDKGNTMVQGAGSNDRQASKGYELMRAGNRMTAKAQTVRKAIDKVKSNAQNQSVSGDGSGSSSKIPSKLTQADKLSRADRRATRYSRMASKAYTSGKGYLNASKQVSGPMSDRLRARGDELVQRSRKLMTKSGTVKKAIAKVSEPVAPE